MVTTHTGEEHAGTPPEPRFAYMLLTHKDPHHVEELAGRILDLSPTGHVVIHHDLASELLPWQGQPPDRVHFVDRRQVLWGDWSIVDATLRMILFAHDQLDADWFVMLSGEHRPIVDLEQWEADTLASDADAFVEATPLPSANRGSQQVRRVLRGSGVFPATSSRSAPSSIPTVGEPGSSVPRVTAAPASSRSTKEVSGSASTADRLRPSSMRIGP
jgi:hypothetical protein